MNTMKKVFVNGYGSIGSRITDDPYGWQYLEDFNKEGSQFR